MFQQVPMVEIDGMELVQSRAILNYITAKHNLYGRDTKERALIDMYIEGMADLNEMFIFLPIITPHEKGAKITQIKESTTNRYFPIFEKADRLFSVLGALRLEEKEENWAFLGQGPSLPVNPPESLLMEHPDTQGIL
uniref:glutathione transferase n=1 Tax=Equus caballus TaxID=9796 RepID=A0A3Q2H3C1_HORSE